MYRRLVVTAASREFAKATSIVEDPIPAVSSLPPRSVLVRNLLVGINAADLLYATGSYRPSLEFPLPIGLEAVGQVVGVGSKVNHLTEGQYVSTMHYGAFAEYQSLPSALTWPVSKDAIHDLPMVLVSGLSGATASLALEKFGRPEKGEMALVTAAAGGTGHIAVQLLHRAGCKVVGICGTKDKATLLRDKLHCDEVINYRVDPDIQRRINKYAPNGIHLVYESVGGHVLEAIINSIARKGRIITIGRVSEYLKDERAELTTSELISKLLSRSASISGFFLPHFLSEYATHAGKLQALALRGELRIITSGDQFVGLERISDAVDHLCNGMNIGKVILWLNKPK